jgi:predicted transcriptional regulator
MGVIIVLGNVIGKKRRRPMANNLSVSKNTSNRDRIDIITSILDASNGGTTRRRILLLSGLSSNQFKRYLSLLIENDYIRMEIQERSKGTAIYRTTDKGIALLRVYQRIRDLLLPDTATNNWFIDYRSSIPMWHNMQKK